LQSVHQLLNGLGLVASGLKIRDKFEVHDMIGQKGCKDNKKNDSTHFSAFQQGH